MKRILALILIFAISFSLFADPIQFEYEPYEEDEFPLWTYELRRAESIFFGSLVITFPLSMAAYNIAANLGMNTPDETYKQVLQQALWASGASLVIALTDWIIGKVSD